MSRERGQKLMSASKPIRADLNERKSMLLMSNPQSDMGQKILREKFNLPAPVQNKVRQCGQKTDANGKLFSAKSNA